MALCDPVIVVPGITATYLRDEYPLPPDNVWKVVSKDFDRITLHPNDLRYELREPARIRPGQIFEIAYAELVEELRENLSPRRERPVPVYPFGYDWRQPLENTEAELEKFVREVIDRTKLMKHYHRAGFADDPRVNLVGHSMGGLIITGYLARAGESAPVRKVVTLATPFRGSFEAVIKVVTGTADIGPAKSKPRERKAARLTPALYHLIPSFKNGIESAEDLPDSLYDPQAWQPGVIDSIKEFIRDHGLPENGARPDAEEIFKAMLLQAEKHNQMLHRFKPESAGLKNEDWLAVVGVGTTTRVRLKITRKNRKAEFVLSSKDRMNLWDDREHAEKRRFTGDGTVPFEGAVPPFLNEDNLVLVTPDDFGYWELQDRAISRLSGFHGMIPNMNMLQRLIIRFLLDKADRHNNTWGRRAPGAERWNPPLRLREKD